MITNYQDIKTLNGKVYYTLEKDEKSRNSDIRLFNFILIEFYKHKLFINYNKKEKGQLAINLLDLYDLPKEDSVKRIRAKIQNHPKNPRFLPTSEKVRKQRKILEETWRKYLGYNSELRTI